MNRNYYMGLLEKRAKRLNELLEMAAPQDVLLKEIKLIVETAALINPGIVKSWKSGIQNEKINECVATG